MTASSSIIPLQQRSLSPSRTPTPSHPRLLDWAINRSRTYHEITAGLLELAYATMEELEAETSPFARRSIRSAAKAAAAKSAAARATAGTSKKLKRAGSRRRSSRRRKNKRKPSTRKRQKARKDKMRDGDDRSATITQSLGEDELPQLVSHDLAGKTLHFLTVMSLAQAQEEHWLMHARQAR